MEEQKQLVELMIYSKKVKGKNGSSFISYATKYNFLQEDGTRKPKYIKVKFTDDAFKESPVKKEEIKRGILKVDGEQIGCPDKYEITKDENGKDIYPVCWIRGGIVSFTPIAVKHTFHFNVQNEESEEPKEIPEDSEE